MNDNKFYSLKEIAEFTNTRLSGNPLHVITGLADLETANETQASFFSNPRYQQWLHKSKAGVIFVDDKTELLEGRNYLISDNPSQAFQRLIDFFYPPRKTPSGFTGIHPTAVIHPTASIESDVIIGPHAVIDEGVSIKKGSFIGAGVYVGPYVQIGEECLIYANVSIRENCVIGRKVIIQPGAVIGSCGFGYITNEKGEHVKLNQVGNVIIEDDVEIGANTTIDRARFNSTLIGRGSKIDNLVQIGHGVGMGKHNIIVAQTGIAGSTTTGNWVVLAGQVAVAGHLHLSDRVTVAGKSGVSKSLPTGKYSGIPAMPLEEYNRHQVLLRQFSKFVDKLKDLCSKVDLLIK